MLTGLHTRLLPLACLLLTASVLPEAHAAEIRVAVATNFYTVAKSLATAYSEHSDDTVTLISGSTGKLYAQIINQAPVDLFLAADAERPRLLEAENRAVAGSRFTYARGRLVLWSRDPGLIDPADGLPDATRVRYLAIANPQLAPYGAAALQTLRRLGVLELWRDRLVQGENIGQTYQFVASGNAEAGFVARSQLRHAEGSFWLVPATLHDPIDQQAVVIRNNDATLRFARWLRSADTQAMIRDFGYDTEPGYDNAEDNNADSQ